MRIFAIELNNEIKGIAKRKEYIESIIASLPSPDFVALPELALCSYMASQEIWQYADKIGNDTTSWAKKIALKYNTYIGVGYLDWENNNYYNRYLIAGPQAVYGSITKSEGESAVFKRGSFGNIVQTPVGNIAIGICYDSRRKHFYDNIKNEEISLILFPHGSPANPKKGLKEQYDNDYLCMEYVRAFNVPVVYINSVGPIEFMPGIMGRMMRNAGFSLNGKTRIYSLFGESILSDRQDVIGIDLPISSQKLKQEIKFYGDNLVKGNWFFRHFILKKDIVRGIKSYEENK